MTKARQLVGFGIAVMTTLLLLFVLWQFRTIVIYVLISLTLSAALRPLVRRLTGRSFLKRVAWILLYLVVLGTIVFLLFRSGGVAIEEIRLLAQTVSVQDRWTLPVWLEGSSFQLALVARLPPPSKLFEAVTGSQGQLVLPAILGFTQDIGGVVSGALVILFLSIYWGLGQIHFERLWLSLLPSGQRRQARDIWRTIEPDIGAYIRSQVIRGLLAGLLLGLGYWLFGSPYPALLALAGALACLIPVVGAALAVIPPLLTGLLSSVQLGVWTVLYTLLVFFIMETWINPRLFNRRWHNPMLTLVLLIALADAFGIVGIMVAPPASVVIQILWNGLVSHRLASGAATQVSDLVERRERVQAIISSMGEPPPPRVTSSMERLTRLIAKAEPLLRATLPAEPSDELSHMAPQREQEEQNGRT